MSIPPCSPSARNEAGLRLIALVLVALAAPAAHALSSDREQPMDVKSNYSKMVQGSDKQPGHTYLRGDVRVVQGTMQANAAEATIHQDKAGEVTRVVLTGKPAHLQQQQDGGGLVKADAERIDYDHTRGIAELTGNVIVVQQGRGEFRGAHMTYNTNTGEMESGDNTAAGRVHMIIQPKAKPAAPAAAKPSGTDSSS